jgi:hypothetical protein
VNSRILTLRKFDPGSKFIPAERFSKVMFVLDPASDYIVLMLGVVSILLDLSLQGGTFFVDIQRLKEIESARGGKVSRRREDLLRVGAVH